jgi:hypothetical protein
MLGFTLAGRPLSMQPPLGRKGGGGASKIPKSAAITLFGIFITGAGNGFCGTLFASGFMKNGLPGL